MTSGSLLYLWDRRSLYIGRLSAPLKLSQGAACLIVSLGKPFLYRNKGEAHFSKVGSVLTPPGCDVEFEGRGELVVNCMLDPYGEDYAMLKSLFADADKCDDVALFESPKTEHYQSVFREMYEKSMPYNEAYEFLDQALKVGVDPELEPHRVDPRIVTVVSELKSRVHENLSIEDLADVANVSVSRLVQLFKQQTGIPVRRYRCWHRLFVASVMMAKTGNLTHAAVIAGFNDASHFTKTFHSMAGMCPSMLLNPPGGVRLFIE